MDNILKALFGSKGIFGKAGWDVFKTGLLKSFNSPKSKIMKKPAGWIGTTPKVKINRAIKTKPTIPWDRY